MLSDGNIPISGVKQLGALTALVKNYRRNGFQKFDTYVSLYDFQLNSNQNQTRTNLHFLIKTFFYVILRSGTIQ
jgi:hypothetical protein